MRTKEELIEAVKERYIACECLSSDEIDEVIHHLSQPEANEPRFDVLTHLREGGKVLDKDGWVTWRDGHKWMCTDPSGSESYLSADGQVTLLLQLIQGDHFEPYEEPAPKLEEGTAYKLKSNSGDIGFGFYHVSEKGEPYWDVFGYQHSFNDFTVEMENGNPKECK